ncbi:unnamed protein product [Ambrosiozyma monospora]|uniref:Unnamed protein product n=1 Tax=Ambrosiozyma monospora TaxID=43982 RepID=A0ACB5TSK5_AMBMO|nr:unnamed protein product [Ambrosiozyma monospora]
MGQHLSELITSTESYHDNYRRDFMKYRLGKAMQLKVNRTELSDDIQPQASSTRDESEVPNTKASMTSIRELNPTPDVDAVIEGKPSVEVLKLLNALSLKETEKELVEMNPAFLDLEKDMKKKFTGIVKGQNQKFKEWKKALFERQEKFNKDIEQVHKRLSGLQEEIKNMSTYTIS